MKRTSKKCALKRQKHKNPQNQTAVMVKKLRADAHMPHRAHPTDSGADFFSMEDVTLEPGVPVKIFTGIALALPEGTSGLIWGKSSLESKGLKVLAGLIDAPYRGEVIVCMINLTGKAAHLHKGQKIAQLVVVPTRYPAFDETPELPGSERGEGGFGSTG
ncbi:MAG: dUTP diphosphatase [bacterium]